MPDGLEADLRELIARRRVLAMVGSGVSIGATRNAEAASWTGLLKLGAACCRKLNPALDEAWEKRLLAEIASGDLDDTLSAAEKISRKFQAPAGPEFRRWLRETVGPLQLRDAAVIEALRDLQVPLATTNYDDLLEKVTRLPAVTWRDQARVFRVLRGEERAILHLHGHWDEPESVVLGIRSYETCKATRPLPQRNVLRKDWEFGAVDLGVLKRRIYAKDPNFDSESFDGATAHLSNAEPGGAAKVSQTIRPETNQPSSANGARR